MAPTAENHATFWRLLAETRNAGKNLAEALGEIRIELAGTPLDAVAAGLLGSLTTGATLAEALREYPDVFDPRIISAVAAAAEGGVLYAVASRIADAVERGDLASLDGAAAPGGEGAGGGVIRYVNQLIRQALDGRASDIHLDPAEGGGSHVRLRIDGVLREVAAPPVGLYPKVIEHIKAMAAMEIRETRLPQDGRSVVKIGPGTYDLRISVAPVHYGERLVVRILDKQHVKVSLEEICHVPDDLARVRELCHLPCGVVIVNGPAGSGKTTMLYAMLMEINQPERCIVTVEDPVEYAFDGISQMQIRPQIGLTFTRAIRSVLRQDPDVLMVGELRDLEMINLCVQVALTGHLVMTTLHAQTSPGALQRLIDCGLEPFLVNSAVQGVISQRLVRVLCPQCKQPAKLPEHTMPPEALQLAAEMGEAEFLGPGGCDDCRQTGYRGRTALHEILQMDDAVRSAVSETGRAAAIRAAALKSGMKTMLRNGLEKAALGITSVEEVLRVVPYGSMV